MANKVVFEVVATSKGFEVVQRNQKKLQKDIDGTAKSHKKLNKAQDNTNKKEKALFQSNLSASKGFSKMKETMGGGSSGLVGAYATLAANVFAATAAFNALRSAAQVDTLIEGFTFLGNQAGKTSLQIAEGIRQVTDNAISLETALRSASIAVTSGFRTDQISQLTQVARNASIALGRNMTDSIDRLFRGVAKLEPEILDELGILVRLDTAVTEYASSLGKSANQLTDAQRRQAFLNATIEQGAKKYGALSDAVKPNQFDQLSAAFEELTRKGLKLINTVFAPFLSIIAGSSSAMIGGLVLFGSTILTTMIPALGNMAEKQTQVANSAKFMAAEAANAGKVAAQTAKIDLVRGSKAKTKSGTEFSAVSALQKKLKSNTAETKDFQKAQNQVNNTMKRQQAIAKKNGTLNSEAHKTRMQELRDLSNQIEKTQRKQEGRKSTRGSSAFLTGRADAASGLAGEGGSLALIGGAGSLEGFKIAGQEYDKFKTKITGGFKESSKVTSGFFKNFGLGASKNFALASGAAKLFGSALLNAIPVFGQILFFGGMIIGFLKSFFTSVNDVSKALDNMNQTAETSVQKLEQLKKTNNGIVKSLRLAGQEFTDLEVRTIEQGNSLKVSAGILEEFGSNMNLFIREISTGEAKISTFSHAMALLGDGIGLIGDGMVFIGKAFRDYFGNVIDLLAGLGAGFAEMIGFDQDAMKASKAIREIENSLDTLISSLDNSEAGKTIKETLENFDPGSTFKEAVDGGASTEEALKLVKKSYDDLVDPITSANAAANEFSKDFQEFQKVFSKNQKALLKLNTFDELAESFDKIIQKGSLLEEADTFESLKTFVETQLPKGALDDFNFSIDDLVTSLQTGSGAAIDFVNDLKEIATKTRTNADEVKKLNAEIAALGAENKLKDAARVFEKSAREFRLSGKFQISAAEKTADVLEQSKLDRDRALDLLNKEFELNKLQFELEILKLKVFKASEEDQKAAVQILTKLQGLKDDASVSKFGQSIIAADSNDMKALSSSGSTGDFRERVTDAGTALDSSTAEFQTKINAMRESMSPLFEDLRKLGPEGELAASFGEGALQMASSFETIRTAGLTSAEGLMAVGSAITSIGSILQNQAKAQIANIEQQIELEQKRDGKSAESVAKIAAMEKKKEAIAKKAFERNKKMQIASAVANTAAGIVSALGDPGNTGQPSPMRIAFASLIGAMGMAQIAIIRKQQFQGSGGEPPRVQNTALNIGGRSNAVDTSQRATAGELSYLRGDRGVGTNANNFTGAAMGRKGYANGGESIVVGERGPEVITPTSPVDITPNFALGGQAQNINFNISAVDGASVQNMLNEQQGNIIAMIRQAANDNGEGFLETVDPTVYGGGG